MNLSDISEFIRREFDKLRNNQNTFSVHQSQSLTGRSSGNNNADGSSFESESSSVKFTVEDGVLTSVDFLKNETVVKIPKKISEIGRNVFQDKTFIREMVLPDSLKIINEEAFDGCKGLNKVVFPEGLQIIEERSFSGCALKKIIIPKSVKKIHYHAFGYCCFVTDIIIPIQTELYPQCFDDCTGEVWVSVNGKLIPLYITYHKSGKTDEIIRKIKLIREVISPDAGNESDIEFMMHYYTENGNKKAEEFFLTNLNELATRSFYGSYMNPVIKKLKEKNIIPEKTVFSILKYYAESQYVYSSDTAEMIAELIKIINGNDEEWFDKMNQNEVHGDTAAFEFPDKRELQNMSVKEICLVLKNYSETGHTCLEIMPAVSPDKINNYIDRFRKNNIKPDSDYIEWLKQCDGMELGGWLIIHGIGYGHVYNECGVPENYDQIAEGYVFGYGINCNDGKCYQIDEEMDCITPYPFIELLYDMVEKCSDEAYEMHQRDLEKEKNKKVITVSDFRSLKNILKKELETETSGKCGDNLTWRLLPDGTCIISGTGRMYDYKENPSDKEGVLSPFRENKKIKRVIAEDGVTGIGSNSFLFCSELSEFTAGSTFDYIGDEAFAYSGLKSLSLKNHNIRLGNNVFFYRHYLSGNDADYPWDTNSWIESESEKNPLVILGSNLIEGYRCSGHVTIPENVVSIQGGAFARCTSLFSVSMPASVKETGKYVFGSCLNLTEVTLSSGLDKIEEGMFSNCVKLAGISVPEGVKILERHAFKSCEELETITLPSTLEAVGYEAFDHCLKIECIVIPEGTKSIADRAFSWCDNLKKVYIPSTVTEIGVQNFVWCPEKLVIFVKENSYAHKYVLENNLRFELF